MDFLFSRAFTILRGVLYAAGFVWLWSWLAIQARSLDSTLQVEVPAWLRPIGFILATLGALLAGACIATFVTRGSGTPAPFDPPRRFVVSGPYRYVRNPMYIGGAAVLGGAALILSSFAILLLALVFLVIMHTLVVLHEEPALAKRFGPSYEQYRAGVHRWIVRPPSSRAPRRVG